VAVITQTIGGGGTFATIAAWLAANQTPVTSGNIYIGELIDQVYEVDAGTLAATITSAQTSATNYRWLRSAASAGGYYRPERHTGPRVYVRWTGSGDQAGIRIAENWFRMSGFAIICEDPQEVTGGNKYAVQVQGDNFLGWRMFVKIAEGGARALTSVAPFFYCYYIANLVGDLAFNAVFLNCIAMGSPWFKGANHGFYYDNFASFGAVVNCGAYNLTRGGSGALGNGFQSLTATNARPRCVNNVALACARGFGGLWASIAVDPSDGTDPLSVAEPYQCITSDLSLPFDSQVPRVSAARNGVDARAVFGHPDAQDFRVLASAPAVANGRDQTAIWNFYSNPAGGQLSPDDFDAAPRPVTGADKIGWAIGPYETIYAPLAVTSPTVEVKTIGSAGGRDYATIQAWADATDEQSLIYQNKVLIGELYSDSTFAVGATRIQLKRCIADATHYRHLRVAAGHEYDPVTNFGVKVTGSGTGTTGENNLMEVREDRFRISGPFLLDQTDSSSSSRRALKLDANHCTVNAVYGRYTGGTGTSSLVFIVRGSRNTLTNCIARGAANGTNGATGGINVQNCEYTRVYNCIADRISGNGSGNGLREGANTLAIEIVNCIATACSTGFSHSTAANSPRVQAHNISSDNSADGPGSIINTAAAAIFRSNVNADYRHIPTSPAIKRGRNLALRFSTDFLGRQRFAPFDIGAFEGLPLGPEFVAPKFLESRAFQTLWEIRRQDGTVHLFTDQNEPVVFRGRTYLPGGSFVASNRRGETGLKERSVGTRGAISSDQITTADLAAGRYRGARVREILLGRYAFTQPIEEQEYILGEVRFDGEAWDTDFLSLATLLERNAGRLVTVSCPLKLGSEECGKDITADTLDDVAVVSVADNRRTFSANTSHISASYANDYFGKGELVWLTGANAGVVCQVKSYTSAARTITLEEKVPFNIVNGDTFRIEPGDRKRYVTDCIAKFGNGINFGGDPWIPGTDKSLVSPLR
jgi:uncharacterized phage protein (TIGR02218 family)